MSDQIEKKPVGWANIAGQEAVDFIANLPTRATTRDAQIAAALKRLGDKLDTAKQYEVWHPSASREISLKEQYKVINEISFNSPQKCMQLLPDGALLSGGENGQVYYSTRDGGSDWQSRCISSSKNQAVQQIQALSNGDIYYRRADGRVAFVSYGPERGRTYPDCILSTFVTCFQVSLDGNMVYGTEDGYVGIGPIGSDGHIAGTVKIKVSDAPVRSVDSLPNKDIVVGGEGRLCILKKQADGLYDLHNIEKDGSKIIFDNVQNFPDGRILVTGSEAGWYVYSPKLDVAPGELESLEMYGQNNLRRVVDGEWKQERLFGYYKFAYALAEGSAVFCTDAFSILTRTLEANSLSRYLCNARLDYEFDYMNAQDCPVYKEVHTPGLCLQVSKQGQLFVSYADNTVRVYDMVEE